LKTKVLLLALFVAGIAVSIAIASPPPGKGKGGKQGAGRAESTSIGSTTGTTTTTPSHGKKPKVLLCHKTHSKKHPWVLISVSQSSVKAHVKHGDVPATAAGCPTGPGTGGDTTTAIPSTTT
jgi:hypothetical protein